MKLLSDIKEWHYLHFWFKEIIFSVDFLWFEKKIHFSLNMNQWRFDWIKISDHLQFVYTISHFSLIFSKK